MKTAAKVFLILAIITAAITIITGFVLCGTASWFTTDEGSEVYDDVWTDTVTEEDAEIDPEFTSMIGTAIIAIYAVIFIISGALSLTFSIIALVKMKTHKPGVGLSVCVLLFSSLLAGIFLLCSKPEEYGAVTPAEPTDTNGNDNDFTYSAEA